MALYTVAVTRDVTQQAIVSVYVLGDSHTDSEILKAVGEEIGPKGERYAPWAPVAGHVGDMRLREVVSKSPVEKQQTFTVLMQKKLEITSATPEADAAPAEPTQEEPSKPVHVIIDPAYRLVLFHATGAGPFLGYANDTTQPVITLRHAIPIDASMTVDGVWASVTAGPPTGKLNPIPTTIHLPNTGVLIEATQDATNAWREYWTFEMECRKA